MPGGEHALAARTHVLVRINQLALVHLEEMLRFRRDVADRNDARGPAVLRGDQATDFRLGRALGMTEQGDGKAAGQVDGVHVSAFALLMATKFPWNSATRLPLQWTSASRSRPARPRRWNCSTNCLCTSGGGSGQCAVNSLVAGRRNFMLPSRITICAPRPCSNSQTSPQQLSVASPFRLPPNTVPM